MKPFLRCTALSASGLPSRMTTLPPGPSALARASPASFAPARLSGPKNARSIPAAFLASWSSSTSMLMTLTPALIALAIGVTIALELAGATTITLYFWVTKFSIASTCAAKSRSSFMPTALNSNLSAFLAAYASAPASICLKNSLASDFITRPTFGLSAASAGRTLPVRTAADPNAPATTKRRRVTRPRATAGIRFSNALVIDFLPLGLADGRLKRDPPHAAGSTTDDPMSDSPAGRSPALAKPMIAHLAVARECEPPLHNHD